MTISARRKVYRMAAASVGVSSALSLIYTFYAIWNSIADADEHFERVNTLIIVNYILLAALIFIAGAKIARLLIQLKLGLAGSKLQKRIITQFALVSFVPAAVITVAAAIFFNYGLKSWFDEKVSTALTSSQEVAEAYLKEHKELIRLDAAAMANDLNRELASGAKDPQFFNKLVNSQAAVRALSEAIVVHNGRIIAQTELSFSLAFEGIPPEVLSNATPLEPAILTSETGDRVRAVVKLTALSGTYMIVGRFIDSKVLNYMQSAEGGIKEYLTLKKHISLLQNRILVMSMLLSVLIILLAIVYSINFSNMLIKPIGELVKASERVKAGDFSVQVSEGKGNDEISYFSISFNKMVAQLEKQRSDLLATNRLLDSRRNFIEAVLSGVNAGVIALDERGKIRLINHQAKDMLGLGGETKIESRDLSEISPEISAYVEEVTNAEGKMPPREITVSGGGSSHILLTKVTLESKASQKAGGAIITFDDITSLVSAKRTAAWAEIARRVAHEIKNPLTPIQLAAERLRRKFKPESSTESESFTKYLDTITRHVGDIGKMVEEFVGFARMPSPKIEKFNLSDLVKQAVFSDEIAHAGILHNITMPKEDIFVLGDKSMISQVMTNLLKNGCEALEHMKDLTNPTIEASLKIENGTCTISVFDNGKGFPEEILPRLTEPYVTTKEKGTGLGLAIVRKIIEEHGSQLRLANRPEGGAMASFTLKVA